MKVGNTTCEGPGEVIKGGSPQRQERERTLRIINLELKGSDQKIKRTKKVRIKGRVQKQDE